MSHKKIFISVAVLLIGASAWFGYKKYVSTPAHDTGLYAGKIVIGYAPWPGYLGLYIAADKGFFAELGLDVDLKAYPGLSQLSEEYVSGNIQGRANLTLDAIKEANGGLKHKVVAAIDYSNGSDGIIGSKDVKTLRDTKGERVAFEHGTLEEYFLQYALGQVGMSLDDLVPVNLDPERSAQALVDGDVDAAVTYEPFMGQALRENGGNTLFTSADAPGLITDVLTFRSDFIDEHPETVQAIIEANFRGVRFWRDHPEEANAIIAKRLNTTVDQVPAQLGGLIILDDEDNRTAFTFAIGPQSLYGNLRDVGEFIEEHQGNPESGQLDTDMLIEPRFIRQVLRSPRAR